MKKGPITQMQINHYAKASGDSNPIHIDGEAANKAGLDGTIAHGMLVMGMLGGMISGWAGIKNVRKFRARFKSVAKPGDTLICRGEIVKDVESDEGRVRECRLYVENQRKEIVVDGYAVIRCEP